LYLVSPRSALREPERRLGAQFWRPRLNRSNRSQGEIATVESPRDCAETRVQPHWLIVCAISRLNQHGNFRGCSRLESCRRFLKQGHTCKRHAAGVQLNPNPPGSLLNRKVRIMCMILLFLELVRSGPSVWARSTGWIRPRRSGSA
jgi:hypothetical protein